MIEMEFGPETKITIPVFSHLHVEAVVALAGVPREVLVVSAVLEVVFPGSGPEAGAWEVRVFEDSTPNAFALPGGHVAVTTAMLENLLESEAELAVILGAAARDVEERDALSLVAAYAAAGAYDIVHDHTLIGPLFARLGAHPPIVTTARPWRP